MSAAQLLEASIDSPSLSPSLTNIDEEAPLTAAPTTTEETTMTAVIIEATNLRLLVFSFVPSKIIPPVQELFYKNWC